MSARVMTTAPAVRDREVEVHGIRLHYREHPASDAPGVLLLHGLTGNAWEWDPVAAAFADRYRAVVERLRLAPVALVGHSLGALVATISAARHAETVRRVVLVDLGPDSMTAAAAHSWSRWLDHAAAASYPGPGEALAEWRSANPRAREPELRHYLRHNLAEGADGRWRWRYDAVGLRGLLPTWPDEERQWASLRRMTAPALVVRGARSTVLSRGSAGRMVGELARGRLVELPDAGHDLTVEQPEGLAEVVSRFLAEPVRAD